MIVAAGSAVHPLGSKARVLLVSVFGPYAQDDASGSRADQPDGAVPEPGDPRAGRLLASHVSSLLGIDAHPGEYRRPMHVARLSFAGAIRRGNYDASIRRDWHHVDHDEFAQGPPDVPAHSQSSAARDDRRRGSHCQFWQVEGLRRRRLRCGGRRGAMDADLSRRRRGATRQASSGAREYRHPHHGRDVTGPSRRRVRHLDSVRWLSDGLQLLLDVGSLRGKRKIHRVLQDRTRVIRNYGRALRQFGDAVVLRDGRELSHRQATRTRTAGAHGKTITNRGRCTSSVRRTCCRRTASSNWWPWASRGSGWDWRANSRATRSYRTQTPRTWSARCRATAFACWAQASSAWKSTRPDNIDEAIDHAVSHATEFHQFMLYTPIPGTPLYAECEAAGTSAGTRRDVGPRYSRTTPVQLSASAHQGRRRNRVFAARVPAGL